MPFGEVQKLKKALEAGGWINSGSGLSRAAAAEGRSRPQMAIMQCHHCHAKGCFEFRERWFTLTSVAFSPSSCAEHNETSLGVICGLGNNK